MTTEEDSNRFIVVVPDGLEATASGDPTPNPSFVYRAAIDFACHKYPGETLWLAPANDFGCGVPEQNAALEYLKLTAPDQRAEAIPYKSKYYIDTRGNARGLRQYLEKIKAWPSPAITLIAAEKHAARAALCFMKEGFDIRSVDKASYTIPVHEQVVGRLWYYRHPFLHALYESAAYVRDLLRPPLRLPKEKHL